MVFVELKWYLPYLQLGLDDVLWVRYEPGKEASHTTSYKLRHNAQFMRVLQSVQSHQELLSLIVCRKLTSIAWSLSGQSRGQSFENSVPNTLLNEYLFQAIHWSSVIGVLFAFSLHLKSTFHQLDRRKYETIHKSAKHACNETLLEGAFLTVLNSHHALGRLV